MTLHEERKLRELEDATRRLHNEQQALVRVVNDCQRKIAVLATERSTSAVEALVLDFKRTREQLVAAERTIARVTADYEAAMHAVGRYIETHPSDDGPELRALKTAHLRWIDTEEEGDHE